MKKIFATILAFVYITTSIGATVHFHYCMDKLASWGFSDEQNGACSFCGMAKARDNGHCISSNKSCCQVIDIAVDIVLF